MKNHKHGGINIKFKHLKDYYHQLDYVLVCAGSPGRTAGNYQAGRQQMGKQSGLPGNRKTFTIIQCI